MFPFTWSAVNCVVGPCTRASYPWALAVLGSRMVGEGKRKAPLVVFAFKIARATGLILAAVRQGLELEPHGPFGFALFATVAIASAVRVSVKLSGTSARETEPSRSRTRCP